MTISEYIQQHFNVEGKLYGGNVIGRVWLNPSDKDVVLKDSYPTVRNGWADTIAIPAGKALIKEYQGSPEEFARYAIVSIDDAQAYQRTL